MKATCKIYLALAVFFTSLPSYAASSTKTSSGTVIGTLKYASMQYWIESGKESVCVMYDDKDDAALMEMNGKKVTFTGQIKIFNGKNNSRCILATNNLPKLMGANANSVALNLAGVEKWKNTGKPNDSYQYSDAIPPDRVVAENDRYAVIYQGGGSACATGSHFLVDKHQKSYVSVDAKNCDDRQFKVELSSSALVFKKARKVTAQYPLAK